MKCVSRLSLFIFFLLPFSSLHAATTLDMPFTSQAPYGSWIQPWQDACEETVIVMVDAFYTNTVLSSAHISAQHILDIFDIKEQYFGKSLDENTETLLAFINSFLSWEAHIVENPTLAKIKAELDAGRPIIAATHGKFLYNPHFQDGGPPYHTIVLSGYDEATQEFITQEPGTKRGQNYRYRYDIIMNAIHDFVPGGETVSGPKRVIFTSPIINTSGNIDKDNDGLTKSEELRYGTKTHVADSDNDGYTDKTEIDAGYSPLIHETSLRSGTTLIKSSTSPKVYLLQQNKKRHIINERVFLSHGWKWTDITIVSDRFLNQIAESPPIEK